MPQHHALLVMGDRMQKLIEIRGISVFLLFSSQPHSFLHIPWDPRGQGDLGAEGMQMPYCRVFVPWKTGCIYSFPSGMLAATGFLLAQGV